MTDDAARGSERSRYSAAPLPPYSYVPGHAPHPVSDPRGHMFGRPQAATPALEPPRWSASAEYLFAVDLFNHGYYWEAHEAWESLWLAAGRKGPAATLLKALIKLAAAAVKAREGNAVGVQRHARRAVELLDELRRELPPPRAEYCGLNLSSLGAMAHALDSDAAAGQFAAAAPTLALTAKLRLRGL